MELYSISGELVAPGRKIVVCNRKNQGPRGSGSEKGGASGLQDKFFGPLGLHKICFRDLNKNRQSSRQRNHQPPCPMTNEN